MEMVFKNSNGTCEIFVYQVFWVIVSQFRKQQFQLMELLEQQQKINHKLAAEAWFLVRAKTAMHHRYRT